MGTLYTKFSWQLSRMTLLVRECASAVWIRNVDKRVFQPSSDITPVDGTRLNGEPAQR